jgi:large repetitive protein
MPHSPTHSRVARARRAIAAAGAALLVFAIIAPATLAVPSVTAVDDAYPATEDTLLTVTAGAGVLANDSGGSGPLGATVATTTQHGYLVLASGGSFTYTPNPNWNGADTFTYTASDGSSNSTATVTITVAAVNDPPVCYNGTASSLEDHVSPGLLHGRCSDVDGDTRAFAVTTPPAHLDLDVASNGDYSYTPELNFNGSDSFGVTASDGHGGSATFTVNVTVTAVNDAPVCSAGSASGDEDTTITGSAASSCSDVDGDTLTYARTVTATHGTATVQSNGSFSYVPAANWHGSDSFTVTASDGSLSATTTVSVTVASVNDAPACTGLARGGTEDTTATGNIAGQCSDDDGDTLSFSGGGAGHGTAGVDPDGHYSYAPAADFHGADSFGVSAADGNGGSTPFTVTIEVAAVNDAPVCSAASTSGNEDTTIAGSVSGSCSDVDGDSLTFARSVAASHGTATVNADGSFSYVPVADWHGSDSFTVTASDGISGAVEYVVSVTIASVNDAPVCSAVSASGSEDTTISGSVAGSCSDVDGDGLTFVRSAAADHATATVNPDGAYSYVPAANWHGSDSLKVTASDGNGGTAEFTVSATIASVNDAPNAAALDLAVAQNRSATLDVLSHATDVDGDTLVVSAVTQGAHGLVAIGAGGSLLYTPTSAAYTGADSFTYTVADGPLAATATVSVNVVRDADPPVAAAPTIVMLANTGAATVPVSVSWSATDAQTAVAGYVVEWRDGASAAWKSLYTGTGRAATLRIALANKAIAFRVTATDLAGNPSAVATSVWNMRKVDSASSAISRHGSWTTVRSASAIGRSYLAAHRKSAWVAWSFSGPASIGIVAPQVVGGGTARVYVDGSYRLTVSLAASRARSAQLLALVSVTGSGSHTVKVISWSTRTVTFDAFISLVRTG